MNESSKWIAVARESFRVDMGVMTAKEKSIYRAFIELDDRTGLLEQRDKEAVKIIMAVVGNSLLNDPIFDKLLARARAFYDNDALRAARGK